MFGHVSDLKSPAGQLLRPRSHVQILHFQRVLLNKLPAAFDVFAHQDAEHALGLGGFQHRHAEQDAHVGVEGGFPELGGIHFAQAFIALQGDALAAGIGDRLEEARKKLSIENLNLPKALALTMLGLAAGGGAFSLRNGSTRFGSDQIGYPLILP